MTKVELRVIGGIDTHKSSHHASVLSVTGQLLGDREFPTTGRGHRELVEWLESFGQVEAVGAEGTSSYGTSLTRVLSAHGLRVVEVNQPSLSARRRSGKSDRLDSEQAARAVLAGTATATPKTKTGPVEAIRMLRVVRSTAVKSRTQTMNALHSILVCAPQELHDELVSLRGRTLVNRCAGLRPESGDIASLMTDPDRMLRAATKTSLHDLAARWKTLDGEIKKLTAQITDLVEQHAPALLAVHGVGPEIAGRLLITAGDNTGRLTNEAAFAKLCGVAPQPASSGQSTGRHRLSRGGDRGANSALYLIAITRMRRHEPTRAYVARRTTEGLSKREILRCLKRYIAREVFAALPAPPTTKTIAIAA
jgi:transposase